LIWRIDRRNLPKAKVKPHVGSDDNRIGQNGTPHTRRVEPLVSPLDNYGLIGGGSLSTFRRHEKAKPNEVYFGLFSYRSKR
jgi:hypothetical protein